MKKARLTRRPTSPAYFLGRPAEVWVTSQRRPGARPSGRGDVARD